MIQCFISRCFRGYRNSWYWGSECWGNERIEMLELVFAKKWTDISMQALETILRTTSITRMKDEHISILIRIINRIPSTFALPSDIVRMLWDVHLSPLVPTLEPALLDLYLVAVEHSDSLGAPYPIPNISYLVKKYNTLHHADILWSSAFGNQRHELLFALLQTLDSTTLNMVFSNILVTTPWQDDGEHLFFLHHILWTVNLRSAVSGMDMLPTINPLHAATGITVTTNQVFQCAKLLSHESPERSWKCLWHLCNKCSFGMDGGYRVEFLPLDVIEAVKTSMQRIGDEQYELHNHIPFECAVNLLYQISRDRRVELNLGHNLLHKINPSTPDRHISIHTDYVGNHLYFHYQNLRVKK